MRAIRILPVLLLLVASAAQAVTYIVPEDRRMIQEAGDIVVAVGVTSLVERNAAGAIVTRYTLRLEDVLKGSRSAGEYLVLTERGGTLGDSVTYIPGTPRYQPGERYLVFTEANRNGDPVTYGMGLGQFFFVPRAGRTLSLRAEIEGFNQNLDGHIEKARDAAGFLAYIRGIVSRSIDLQPRYFVDSEMRFRPRSEWNVQTEATRGSYLMTEAGRPFRWSNPTATFVKAGTAVGVNGDSAVTKALGQWNGTDSSIDYKDGGQDNTATGGISDDVDTSDGKNAILFDDPNDQIPSSGVAGVGGITEGGNPYTLGGETFWDVLEVDVVMNDILFPQSCFDTVMTHELGHTLGFRHSNQNGTNDGPCSETAVCTSNALMNATVSCGWNGVLRNYDRTAANTVYGTSVCTAPSITDHPESETIRSGQTVAMSVEVTGTKPFQYQWYEGPTKDISRPVGSDRSSFNTLPLTATTSFWVRVSNTCGTADSMAAAITVIPSSRRRAVGHP